MWFYVKIHNNFSQNWNKYSILTPFSSFSSLMYTVAAGFPASFFKIIFYPHCKKVFGLTGCRPIFPFLRSRMPIHGRWNNYLNLQSEFFNWREGKPVPLLRAGLFPPSEHSNHRSHLLNGKSPNNFIQGAGRKLPPLPPPPTYTYVAAMLEISWSMGEKQCA